LSVSIQLQPDDLKVVRYPPWLVPAEAFHEIAALVGHRLDAPVSSNQPITARDVAPKVYSPIVQRLPPGTVAVSVSLSAAQAAGGWVFGGMQVWLYATQNGHVRLLSRHARILAVDGRIAPMPRLAPWTGTAVLTVAVPQTVAPAVIQANQTGGLALALTAAAIGGERAP
jgi:Flp pilus assembly protein CpaB